MVFGSESNGCRDPDRCHCYMTIGRNAEDIKSMRGLLIKIFVGILFCAITSIGTFAMIAYKAVTIGVID